MVSSATVLPTAAGVAVKYSTHSFVAETFGNDSAGKPEPSTRIGPNGVSVLDCNGHPIAMGNVSRCEQPDAATIIVLF